MLIMLQFHRGTYTSHGSIKKGNRKSEILLRDVEVCLHSLTCVQASSSYNIAYGDFSVVVQISQAGLHLSQVDHRCLLGEGALESMYVS